MQTGEELRGFDRIHFSEYDFRPDEIKTGPSDDKRTIYVDQPRRRIIELFQNEEDFLKRHNAIAKTGEAPLQTLNVREYIKVGERYGITYSINQETPTRKLVSQLLKCSPEAQESEYLELDSPILEVLGSGNQEIFLARHKGRQVVLKVFKNLQQFYFEREVGRRIGCGTDHHLLCYLGWMWVKDGGGILYDYIDGKDAERELTLINMGIGKRFTFPQIIHIFKQLAQALQYLHSKRLLHLDIKPQNIILKYDKTKDLFDAYLIDYDLSCHDEPKDKCASFKRGTPGYIPPEMFTKEHSTTTKSDIYSLGATYYDFLNHTFRIGERFSKTLPRRFTPLHTYETFGNNKLKELISEMLHTDYQLRIDIDTVVQILDDIDRERTQENIIEIHDP